MAPSGEASAPSAQPGTQPKPGAFAAVGADLSANLDRQLEQVEQLLYDAVRQTDRLADESSRYLLSAGGKRVRPSLVLLAAQWAAQLSPEANAESFDVVKAGAVVELTHLATLYHDDVMDEAPVRRGAPAAHQVWNNSVAILTGDVLLARASSLCSELGARAVLLQSETFERLVLGQLSEYTGPEDGADAVEHHIRVLSDKTGSLIAACGEFAVLAAGGSAELVEPLRQYGENVGVAFQLADDIIDLASEEDESGKTPGTDLREGVPTMPTLLIRREAAAGDAEAQRIVDLLNADLSSDEALEAARTALVAHPVMEDARAEARRWSARAVEALRDLPDGPIKAAFELFAAGVVNRVG
ncbi:polyprenyl synthetase family protein [Brevibacterium sp. HMSC07C04]|uniref:polyprenyl synthetase family protein n=1 Tax=Brevibacterium sp. HMSC07C04 TaxID=1581130 RepID=UPI0008A3B090|nr:polyprenyl synthetase family protein [Brevibacterium sp. HMSC07C04]OFS27726.1 geranylgeranyl pyrophosphate synthase [Brevibacterium sp. HMSC07C04]